eukprot:s88_g3.t1
MEVCFAASGEQLTVLDADEVQGHSAKSVKQSLAAQVGVTRFRQKLFWEDGSEIQDDVVFALVPGKIQLVILEFWPPDAEQERKMISAVVDDDSVALEELLKCPRDPNVTDEDRYTPLHRAAMTGHVGATTLLLEAGAEIEARNITMFGMVPLHLAASRGYLDVVRVLLEAGAEKDQLTTNGQTPMLCAAWHGHRDVVKLLLEAGVEKNPTTNRGLTPLHLAAALGYLEIVRLLVESGADYHLTTSDGKAPLDVASENRHDEIVRFLAER